VIWTKTLCDLWTSSLGASTPPCGARKTRRNGISRRCAILLFISWAIRAGRIYNYRVGLTADWEQVFALAVELDKAVEVDCYPDRQDLSVDLLHKAERAGCRISLGTDSHNPTELGFIEFGLAAVLLAGIDPLRILNFMSCNELTAWASSVTCG
jgi:hypothetical protein